MVVSSINYYKNISTPRHPTWFPYYRSTAFPTQIFRDLLKYLILSNVSLEKVGGLAVQFYRLWDSLGDRVLAFLNPLGNSLSAENISILQITMYTRRTPSGTWSQHDAERTEK
jgi:hypothetical protein